MYKGFDFNVLGDEDDSIELKRNGVVLKTISGEKSALFMKQMLRMYDEVNPHFVNHNWVEFDEPQHIIREYVGDAFNAK